MRTNSETRCKRVWHATSGDYRLPFLPLLVLRSLARAALPLPLLAVRIAFLTFKTSPPDDSVAADLFDFFVAGSLSSLVRMARFCDFSFSAETSAGSNWVGCQSNPGEHCETGTTTYLPLYSLQLLLALQLPIKPAHARSARACDRKRPVDLLFAIPCRERTATCCCPSKICLVLSLVLCNTFLALGSSSFGRIVVHVYAQRGRCSIHQIAQGRWT